MSLIGYNRMAEKLEERSESASSPPPPPAPSFAASFYRVMFQRGNYLESNNALDNRILWKYLKAILPGLILLLSHGTQLLWALSLMPYRVDFDIDPQQYETKTIHIIMILTYFVGGLAGVMVGAALVTTIPKYSIYKIIVFITIAVGILFVTSNWHEWTLVAGRAVAGFAHSLNMLTVLVHASEVASHQMYRHKVMLIVGLVLAFSHLLPAILVPNLSFDHTNVLVGVEHFMLAIAAFGANSYYTKESPSFLLFRSVSSGDTESQRTYDLFKFLQTGPIPVFQLHTEYEALKMHVQTERTASRSITADGNPHALLLCISARLISVLAFNVAACYYVILIQNIAFYGPNHNSSLPLILFYLVCGSITTVFTYRNRHKLYAIVAVVAAVHSLIAVANLVSARLTDLYVNPWPLFIGIISGLVYVYCFTMPIGIMSWITMGEAFALSKKPLSIAAVIIAEHLIQILLIAMAFWKEDLIMWMLIVFGMLAFACFTYVKIPRATERLSLEKCPDAYKRQAD